MNILLLTTGISGSSVVTGLIASQGFWTGDKTVYKDNYTGTYETYENEDLVKLNERLISESNINVEDPDLDLTVTHNHFEKTFNEKTIDLDPFIQFITKENSNAPWIWKDPRLRYTIGFWQNLFDHTNTRVLILKRNTFPLWISLINKRIIYDFSYLKNTELSTQKKLIQFCKKNNLKYCLLNYDSLVRKPEDNIKTLNTFLNINLTLNNWSNIYKKPKFSKSILRIFLAPLIYLKNYNERINN